MYVPTTGQLTVTDGVVTVPHIVASCNVTTGRAGGLGAGGMVILVAVEIQLSDSLFDLTLCDPGCRLHQPLVG